MLDEAECGCGVRWIWQVWVRYALGCVGMGAVWSAVGWGVVWYALDWVGRRMCGVLRICLIGVGVVRFAWGS